MRLDRLFVGGYREIRRPVIPVNESLMSRIEKARQDLLAKGKEVVSARVTHCSPPGGAPKYVRATDSGPRPIRGSFNRAA